MQSTLSKTRPGSAERRGPSRLPAAPGRCIRKFFAYYADGFNDPGYVKQERGYKERAHLAWQESLNEPAFRMFLDRRDFREIAHRALKIEGATNLLFPFEKMALRDAVGTFGGARRFAEGLYRYLHGEGEPEQRFTEWVETVQSLPSKRSRVPTWPVVTIFGFIARPDVHIYLKPTVTRRAAAAYDFDFQYSPTLSWDVYRDLLTFANIVDRDLRRVRNLKPADMIDVQSFLWVQGSDEC